MNNTTDSFEAIAKDAVELLTCISLDLGESDRDGDHFAALILAAATASFCERAIALGGE